MKQKEIADAVYNALKLLRKDAIHRIDDAIKEVINRNKYGVAINSRWRCCDEFCEYIDTLKHNARHRDDESMTESFTNYQMYGLPMFYCPFCGTKIGDYGI